MKKTIKKGIKRSEAIVVGKPGYETITESFNRLKDNILFFNIDGKNKVIQIESSVSKEGKTTVITNLAVSLALNQKKVIVVDGDLRCPRAHRPFNLVNENGIAEYMLGTVGKNEIIKHTSYNVDIICRGSKVENPSAILASDKFKNLIASLKKEYDYVLIDCPPVLEISDYINISTITDGTLFCVAYGKTRRGQVKDAIRLLKNQHIKLLGIVYTLVDKKVHKGNYYQNNYNHYSYYQNNYHEDIEKTA